MPVVEARKMLLIGLGTTGADICHQILERLQWQYDTPDRVPWLKCLVFETAPIPQTYYLLHRHATINQLSIGTDEYRDLITNPQNYRNLIDFEHWNIPSITQNVSAIQYGANNTRILGRLAVMFPSNHGRMVTAITNAINALSEMTGSYATGKHFANPGDNDGVQFIPKDAGAAHGQVYVYVVGSLCGGTSSGSFIDIGYLLQKIPGYGNVGQNASGIFLLPSAAESNSLLVANAYAALLELNHFSSNNTEYTAQFANWPGDPCTPGPGCGPYRYTYLVQCPGATPQSFATLKRTTADYLYSDMIGGTGSVRDAKRTDASQYFVQKDNWGATQRYFTFGMSAVQFPSARVRKACCLRLLGRGFSELLGGAELVDAIADKRAADIQMLSARDLVTALLKTDGQDLEARCQGIMEQCRTAAEKSNGVLEDARLQIAAAFQSMAYGPVHPDLPVNCVDVTIASNMASVKGRVHSQVLAAVGALMTGPDGFGVPALRKVLAALKQRIERELKVTDGHDKVSQELSVQADEILRRLERARTSLWLALTFRRSKVVKRLIREFTDCTMERVRDELQAKCASSIRDVLVPELNAIDAACARIDRPMAGLQQDAKRKADALELQYGATISVGGAPLNGEELFDGVSTVDAAYSDCLAMAKILEGFTGSQQDYERRKARDAVRTYLDDVLEALWESEGVATLFDATEVPPPDSERLLQMAQKSTSVFDALTNQSVIAKFLANPDRNALATNLEKVSTYLLDCLEGSPAYMPASNKMYGFLFYDNTDPKAQELLDVLATDSVRPVGINDRHQVFYLKERAAFSLNIAKSCASGGWWQKAYNDHETVNSYHSRGDVDHWVGWAKETGDNYRRARSVFMIAVALDVIAFRNASTYVFSYPPKGLGDSGQCMLPNEVDLAANQLLARQLVLEVGRQITNRREELGDPGVINRLGKFVLEKDASFTEGGRILSQSVLTAIAVDFIMRDAALMAEYERMYPNPVTKSMLQQKTGDDQPYYYCCHCGKKLGNSVDCLMAPGLEPGQEQTLVMRCSYADCRKLFT